MSSTLPPFDWPIPEDTDPLADGAAAIRMLAGAIGDTLVLVLGGLMVQAGSRATGPSGQSAFTEQIQFPRPFAAAPSAVVNIATGAGGTSDWGARAISLSAAGFTIFGFGPSATFSTLFQWIAVGPAPGSSPHRHPYPS